ncbi:hypothetical protein BKI52_22375 [marine bacterium AO1-C]|nr:hypothetical protein BKI52_22375 [marine bacterium AO1-C]
MSFKKLSYLKRYNRIWLLCYYFVWLAMPGCQQKENQANESLNSQDSVAGKVEAPTTTKKSPPKRVLFPQKAPAGQAFYLTQNYKTADLEKVKKQELAKWSKELNQEFGVAFKTLHTQKYFNVAYRCSEEKMKFLMYTLRKFFEQIYPVYFKYEPTYPFQIVYFNTKKEYSRYTGSEAYGFYLPKTRTLYTYGNSGEGTLWHELVHAFVAANIDHRIQQWFSEGFASFYEMGAVYGDKFYEGYTNWRHPTLKRKIREEDDFMDLADFVSEKYMSEGYGYAKARFLFCYLWIYNKMPEFVKIYLYELSPKYKGEELGEQVIKTLEKLLGKKMEAIEKDYKAIALTYKKFVRLKKKN